MAASAFFHKPELAIRRAAELENINQEDSALSMLHEVLSSRRHRTWSPAYEQIMIAYIDLCLKMKKSREVKDGLHQYRNLCQTQAPGSLEKVIRYLMEKAEQKCTDAKAYADAEAVATTIEEEDEEGFVGASPQAILLSTMSTDPEKSQRDSTLVLPSLKFLWETYRTVLDILRSNSKLEHVYHFAAQNALKFCQTYKRRMEFRHLCDMLRMHLGNLRQYGSITEIDDSKANNKVRGWEGWTTESIELHLQTRFAQLETASILHRYTEGFRTCEDIFNILQINQARRKLNPDIPPPKAKLMASYYEKLTTLFWVSENYLFHAYAWYKYYTLCREYNRSMSEDMKRMQASAVLLATLCIPTLPHQAGTVDEKQHGITTTIEDGILKQKMGRMSTLLGFHTRNPNRDALLAEIRSKNILDQVPQYLRDLYYLLEENADPLIMVEHASPLLEQLNQEIGATTISDSEKYNDDIEDTTLGRYVKPLTSVLLLKLIVNLAAAYHTVSLDHLKKLTSGLDMSFEQVEKSLVLFTQSKTLSVRIDHRAGCLRFGDPTLESEAVRSQLTVLSKQLEAVSQLLQPPDVSKRAVERQQLYLDIRTNLQAEYKATMGRKDLIESRKEETERMVQEKAKEEARKKAEEEASRRADDAKRLAREQRLRELEKQRKIQEELDTKEKKRFLAAMGKNLDEISQEELAKIDTEALQREHQDKINRKKEDAERKTREIAKKLDYLVRAIRIEEVPIVKKRYEEKTKQDRERYEEEIKEKRENAKKQWEADVKDKAILQEHDIFKYMKDFESKVMEGRKLKHEELCQQAEAKAELEAEKDKVRRARKRKEDEERQKREEEKRLREEEERVRLEEEKLKKEEARREREAKEEERRQAELQQTEQEQQRQESSKGPSSSGASQKYIPPSLRGRSGAARSESGARSQRFESTGSYPGGGRYDGRPRGDRRDGSGRDGGGRDGGARRLNENSRWS